MGTNDHMCVCQHLWPRPATGALSVIVWPSELDLGVSCRSPGWICVVSLYCVSGVQLCVPPRGQVEVALLVSWMFGDVLL